MTLGRAPHDRRCASRSDLLLAATPLTDRGRAPTNQSETDSRDSSDWISRIVSASTPDAKSPVPSGPYEFSPSRGSLANAVHTSAVMWLICQRTSSRRAASWPAAASEVAFAAYAAAPRACPPYGPRPKLVRQRERPLPLPVMSPIEPHARRQISA